MRNPKRTAASASALMIGVGLVGFITIFASSTKASVNSAIDRSFAGDIVVDSGGGPVGRRRPERWPRQLGKLPEVQAATGCASASPRSTARSSSLRQSIRAPASQIFDVSPVQGSIADLGPSGIAVYKDVATADHLKLGSTVPVLFTDTGPQS